MMAVSTVTLSSITLAMTWSPAGPHRIFGDATALAAAILAFCGDRLAGFKHPRTIDFTEALPRDPNGKLYKRVLRDPYWQGRDRAI